MIKNKLSIPVGDLQATGEDVDGGNEIIYPQLSGVTENGECRRSKMTPKTKQFCNI